MRSRRWEGVAQVCTAAAGTAQRSTQHAVQCMMSYRAHACGHIQEPNILVRIVAANSLPGGISSQVLRSDVEGTAITCRLLMLMLLLLLVLLPLLMLLLVLSCRQQMSEWGPPPEEQACWVLVSAPILTLTLPGLLDHSSTPVSERASERAAGGKGPGGGGRAVASFVLPYLCVLCAHSCAPSRCYCSSPHPLPVGMHVHGQSVGPAAPVASKKLRSTPSPRRPAGALSHLALVVGGTGIAPALQVRAMLCYAMGYAMLCCATSMLCCCAAVLHGYAVRL